MKLPLPPGPWNDEPDRIEFEAHGFPCLMKRNDLGAWCGYVAVPPGHPLYGKGYDDADVTAHGGLTYANSCQGEICHVPKPGQPDNVWWLGFDCAHYNDVIPAMAGDTIAGTDIPTFKSLRFGCTYRDVAYVRAECEQLAEQIAEVAARAAVA